MAATSHVPFVIHLISGTFWESGSRFPKDAGPIRKASLAGLTILNSGHGGTMKHNWLILTALGLGLAAIVAGPSGTRADGGPNGEVTFAKNIAPILYKNCAVCHHPGTVAPMSLLTYKEVRPWARAIQQVVAARAMPPCHADPKYGVFENDRHLDQKEVDMIVAWVNQGAKEGTASDRPPIPTFADQEGWSIGKPDVVLSMPKAVSVPDTGTVPY